MLNVTGLFFPSHPHSPSNYTNLTALFAPQADFVAEVWMGWEAGQAPHRLAIDIGGPFSGNPIVATFGYHFESGFGPTPVIVAGASNQAVILPAPPPGIHHFLIARAGAQFSFYLNGDPFASFADTFGSGNGRSARSIRARGSRRRGPPSEKVFTPLPPAPRPVGRRKAGGQLLL
jgi:hypothetical protein